MMRPASRRQQVSSSSSPTRNCTRPVLEALLRPLHAPTSRPAMETLEPRQLLASTPLITEFMADNNTALKDQDGAASDWIELHNPTPATLNLAGWSLTDDPTTPAKWVFPATLLAPGDYMIVFASGKNRVTPGAELHTNFSLSSTGEYLALVSPSGTVASEYKPQYPKQLSDLSYGLSRDAQTTPLLAANAPVYYQVPTSGNLATAWTLPNFPNSMWTAGTTGVGFDINTANPTVPGFTVRMVNVAGSINNTTTAENLLKTPLPSGFTLQQDVRADAQTINHGPGGNFSSDQNLPNGLTNDEQYVLEITADLVIPQGTWTFNVGSDDGFLLRLSNGTFTNGTNTFAYTGTRGHANTSGTIVAGAGGLSTKLTLIYFENTGGDDVELSVASGTPTFSTSSFVLLKDGAFPGLSVKTTSASPPPDYLPLVKTNLQSAMLNKNASVYLRMPLNEVVNPERYELLKLRIKYDDGFVAYLNGTKIAARNAPTSPVWNSPATAARPDERAIVYEEIEIPLPTGLLKAGTGNVLAIHGMNQASGEGDFLILPELDALDVAAENTRYFTQPTPGQPNGVSNLSEIVKDPKFSVEHGFYDAPFQLTITSATAGAQIRYTLDGSAPTETNGTLYTGPITISQTTTIRALAFKADGISSTASTETYIFANDVIRQSATGTAPAGWPAGSVNGQLFNYGMDPDIVNNPAYSSSIASALKSIPTFSIVMDLKDLVNSSTGIYVNADQDGREWERPMSLELINPDGSKGFQIDGGIRIRGGYSRSDSNPKHAFRFFFRDEYGASTLDYPLFGENAVQSFEKFDLRTSQNYSWSFDPGDAATWPQGRDVFVRDQFARDTQLEISGNATRGNFYHLYINGQYWGLYNTEERPEAAFAASYYGGTDKDYDVIKVEAGSYTLNATDGDMAAWTRLWNTVTDTSKPMSNNAYYYALQGRNPDGTVNPNLENLLDVDSLIDYELIAFYTGNFDAPLSGFLSNGSPNNFYAIRSRTRNEGFKFFLHDSEHSMLLGSTQVGDGLTADRTGPFNTIPSNPAEALSKSNPQWIFDKLTANAEFRQRVADRIQKLFFNGGALTPEATRARFLNRTNQISAAVIAESARWGDSKRSTPLTQADWQSNVNALLNTYFPQRSGIVLNQLKADSLYPSVAAPVFSQRGGTIGSGFKLTLSAASGTIYYTTDGSDPRLLGGGVNTASAKAYTGQIPLSQSTLVRARVLSGGTWSALDEATFSYDMAALRISEIMYHAQDLPVGGTYVTDDFDYVELQNTSTTTTLNLVGVQFATGITFTFPNMQLAPGQRVIVAKNVAALLSRYPGLTNVVGPYSGNLDNAGEQLVLKDATGQVLQDITYSDGWYPHTDGQGYSLVALDPKASDAVMSTRSGWRPSWTMHGNPGAADTGLNPGAVVINEALTHTDDVTTGDWIELYNTTNQRIDLSYWYLSDTDLDLKKYRLPAGTFIEPYSYLVLTQVEHFGAHFGLSELGEKIILSSGDAAGNLGGYRESETFGAADREVPFGRHIKSGGGKDFVAMSKATPGEANDYPLVGPVIISELMYAPVLGGTEFIELHNVTSATLSLYDPANPLNAWKFTAGVTFSFPAGASIPANGYALVVPIDPAVFRSTYNIDPFIPIYGPYTGILDNAGEVIELSKPGVPEPDGTVPYYTVDKVNYSSVAPWPTEPNATGATLARFGVNTYGNDVINWRSAPAGGTPGRENYDLTAPTASIDSIAPDSAGNITIRFSERVQNFGLEDLFLTIDGTTNLLTGAATLSSTDGIVYTLSGLALLEGGYTLMLRGVGSDIVDPAGNPLANNASTSFSISQTTITGGAAGDSIYLRRSGNQLQVFLAAQPVGQPHYSFNLASVTNLVIDSGDGNDTLTLDLSGGSFIPADFLFKSGGGSDTIKVLGGSSGSFSAGNVLVVDGATAGVADIEAVEIRNVPTFSFLGASGADNLAIDAPAADQVRVRDAAGNSFATLSVVGASKVIVETADGDDRVSVDALATGLDVRLGAGNNTVSLNGGSYQLDQNLSISGSNLTLNLSGTANLSVARNLSLSGLSMTGQSKLVVAAAGSRVLRTGALSIDADAGATLDLNDNAMLVEAQSGNRQQVLEMVLAATKKGWGSAAQRWQGSGITSSAAQANAIRGLAVVFNARAGGSLILAEGDANAIVVKYAYNGDVNLDGEINLNDYFIVDQNYLNQTLQSPPRTYGQGDLNFDGDININDYFMMDSAYLNQRTTVAASMAATADDGILVQKKETKAVFSKQSASKQIKKKIKQQRAAKRKG